jgi:NTE family protein
MMLVAAQGGRRWSRVAVGSIALLLLSAGAPLNAFQGPEQQGPVVGLALSGGAARGLAHIGVIQELEARGIRVHVVTGTSMGSLVGGLYALGLPGDSLEAVARRFNAANLFTDQVPRRYLAPDQRLFDERLNLTLPIRGGRVHLPGGALEGSGVSRALERETWAAQGIGSFDLLPRPFTAVATDIRTGVAVPLRSGGIAEAIRASIAIPGLLEPVESQGMLLVDGALVRNLPAQDARDLGAELLICSDVAVAPAEREYDSMLSILSRAISLDSEGEIERQYEECDVVLRPVEPELDASDFLALERWLALGRQAVRDELDEIVGAFEARRLGGSLPRFLERQRLRAARLQPDSVRIDEIRLDGLEALEQIRPARAALRIAPGEWVDSRRVDRSLASLQATDLYGNISYELSPSGTREDPGRILVVRVEPIQRDRVGVGVRFDDRYKASILVSTTLMNRLGYGTSTRLDLRLGEELQVQLTHLRGRGVTSSVGIGLGAGFSRVPLYLTEAGQRVLEVRNEQVFLSGLVGLVESQGGMLGVEIRGEHLRERPTVGSGLSAVRRRFTSAAVVGWRDSFDRAAFPRSGSSVRVRSEWADRGFGSGARFRHHLADLRLALPMGSRWATHLELFAGAAGGEDLPLSRHFFLGGSVSSAVLAETHPYLHGLDPQEEWGRVAQAARLGVQWEFRPGWFTILMANAGDTRDEWRIDPGDWSRGWGISVGTVTPLGPARATLAGGDSVGDILLSVNLGPVF